jgi:hypothetical protein
VNRTARRAFPENAPFLDFDPESQEDYSEMVLDDLPPAVYGQEAIEAQVPEDYRPQRWLVLSDAEWRRLLAADKPEELELYLYLTEEQGQVLESAPPVLLSGPAPVLARSRCRHLRSEPAVFIKWGSIIRPPWRWNKARPRINGNRQPIYSLCIWV